MGKGTEQLGGVKMTHRQAANYGVHPVSGFLVSKGENGQPWILHPYTDVPEIQSEEYKSVPGTKTMVGAGVSQRMVRLDIGAFLVSEATLKSLSDYLKKEFKEKTDGPEKPA